MTRLSQFDDLSIAKALSARNPSIIEVASVRCTNLSFAKTLADSEINDIAAAVPPAFCYNSWPCFNSSACASERWFASVACDEVSSSRILRYANNSPYWSGAVDART